jgi:hypothetical protein
MPEYVFYHGQNPGSLYTYFYQYFLARWNDPNIPEYALDTDELIYRDNAGNEIRRESFLKKITCSADKGGLSRYTITGRFDNSFLPPS